MFARWSPNRLLPRAGPGGTARKTAWAAFPAAAQLDRCDRLATSASGASTYPRISPLRRSRTTRQRRPIRLANFAGPSLN